MGGLTVGLTCATAAAGVRTGWSSVGLAPFFHAVQACREGSPSFAIAVVGLVSRRRLCLLCRSPPPSSYHETELRSLLGDGDGDGGGGGGGAAAEAT